MTNENKKALIENRIKVLENRGKDNFAIVKKLRRQLKKL
jgi:hypothetical protein